MPSTIGKPSTIENIKAVNAAFGFTIPKEIASNIKTCTEANDENKRKALMYVPLIKAAIFTETSMKILTSRTKPPVKDIAFGVRALITEALGTFLGGIVLLVIDVAFTILVKPFLNLAVWLLNKKAEREAKAKELELEAQREAYYNKIDSNDKQDSKTSFSFHNLESTSVLESNLSKKFEKKEESSSDS